MFNTRIATIIILFLLAVCCKPTIVAAKAIASNNLTGQWWLTAMFSGQIGAVESDITMAVEQASDTPNSNGSVPPPEEEIVYGNGGCNDYFTTYTMAAPNLLSFDDPFMSKTYCEGPNAKPPTAEHEGVHDPSIMETEQTFILALIKVVRYEITESDGRTIITMFDDAGEPVLSFASEPLAQKIFLPAVMR